MNRHLMFSYDLVNASKDDYGTIDSILKAQGWTKVLKTVWVQYTDTRMKAMLEEVISYYMPNESKYAWTDGDSWGMGVVVK